MEDQPDFNGHVHVVVLGNFDRVDFAARVALASRRIGQPRDYSIHHLLSSEEIASFTDAVTESIGGAIYCLLVDAQCDSAAARLASRLRQLPAALVLSFAMRGETSATRDFVACFPFRPRMLPLVMEYIGILLRNGLRQQGHIGLDWNDVLVLLGRPGAATLLLATSTRQEYLSGHLRRRLPAWDARGERHTHLHLISDVGLLGRTLKAASAVFRRTNTQEDHMAVSLEYHERIRVRAVAVMRRAF
ncbi:MAG: hypothetical protein JWP36_2682 [Paucimonas sp.]|nr:hypothetical protein [Paucimonas sp.]